MAVEPRWRRLLQFRLRTFLIAVMLFLLVGNGLLVWWRMPFAVERKTRNSSAEIVNVYREEVYSAWRTEQMRIHGEDAIAPQSGFATPPPAPRFINFCERWQVYCNLRGERIRHGPREVRDEQGRRVYLEHWSHGRLHGPALHFTTDGERVIWGEYQHGEKQGLWRHRPLSLHKNYVEETYDRGVLRAREEYREGMVWLRESFGPDGTRTEWARFAYAMDVAAVDAKRFTSDATGTERVMVEIRSRRGEPMSFVGPTRGGLEHGKWEFRNYSGELVLEAEFDRGRLIRDGKPAPAILPPEHAGESAAVQRIRAFLECPIMLRMSEARLDKVFAFISELHDAPLQVDADACRRAGISPDQPITLDLRSGCTVRAALQIVAAEAGLAVVYRNGALVALPGSGADSRH
jgi:hypothetical protein